MNRFPMTLSGETALREELERLKRVDRPRITKAIAEAREHGDLKENAEYHAAKEQQSHNEGRIEQINDIIARANVIDVSKLHNDGKVIFGSTVFLENLDNGEKVGEISVPTNLVFVGASNAPSVDLANADVVAD